METKKQEAIRLAYVKILGEEKYNEIKDSICENGRCKKYHWLKNNYSEEFINNNFYIPVEIDNDKWFLPNSIKYIRINNGWISIESEEDLPKTEGTYWIYDNANVTTAYYNFGSKFQLVMGINCKATHYQPIQKPKPPIFLKIIK